MSTKFLSPGWRMPRNANQSKSDNYSLDFNASSYINLGTSDSLNFVPQQDAFSVSVWVKNTSTSGFGSTIYSYNADSGPRQIQLTYDSTALQIYAVIGGSNSVANVDLTDVIGIT